MFIPTGNRNSLLPAKNSAKSNREASLPGRARVPLTAEQETIADRIGQPLGGEGGLGMLSQGLGIDFGAQPGGSRSDQMAQRIAKLRQSLGQGQANQNPFANQNQAVNQGNTNPFA